MGRLYEAFKRVNRTKRSEDSLPLRVTTLASVMIAVLATMVSGASDVGPSLWALVLLPVGAWLSHVRRDKDNTFIKLLLTIGAAAALVHFFGGVRTAQTLDDTRTPLTTLFLGVQVLHGFDLPARRDLGFTLASSLALVALAGTNSHSGFFGVLLLAYAGIAGAAMVGMQRSAARETADDLREEQGLGALDGGDVEERLPSMSAFTAGSGAKVARSVATSGAGLLRISGPVLLVGLLVFLLLPRAESSAFTQLPFRGFGGVSLGSPLVTNPGLPDGGRSGPLSADDPPPGFSPVAYFGFAEYVDLRTVGRLSDDPVLRVRADRPRFWRGLVFDTYTGLGWTRSGDAEDALDLHGLPINVNVDGMRPTSTARVVQTYELLADTPNLVFSAADAREIYLAGRAVNVFDDGTITTPQLMDRGTIYSVISEVTTTAPEVLRTRRGAVDAAFAERYTQLPDDVPQRVHDLAETLAGDAKTNYAKAEAIEAWIGANTEYTLDAPPPARGGDLVDHFLFESRAGWCEPISASMVVLLRSQGVPARFATGFQPGDRNPITGVWDVKMSDAHAWVEVWVPHEGWIPFDPTGAVPLAVDGTTVPKIPLLEIGRWVGSAMLSVIPGSVKTAATDLARTIGDHPGLASVLAAIAGVLAGLGLVTTRRRRHEAALAALPPFDRVAQLLRSHGVPRDPWQTPREYVERIRLRRPDVPEAPLRALLDEEEGRRYAGKPATSAGAADSAARTIREYLEHDDH